MIELLIFRGNHLIIDRRTLESLLLCELRDFEGRL